MQWRASPRQCSVILLVLLVGCSLLPTNRTVICDGVFPQWVLDAQDYDGSGCAEALPFDRAPGNADWTPVCTGMCLCGQGEVLLDDVCAAIPPDQPWPPSVPYP